jgi:hypothetical protein
MRMRTIGTAILITALSASTVFAASTGPLAPGKPAGVRQAQDDDNGHTMLLIAGATLVGIGIALAVSNNDNNNNLPSTTTPVATGTTP